MNDKNNIIKYNLHFLQEVIQTKETEEMIDVINSLNQELEYKKAEVKHSDPGSKS
jgi:hypothetical protein